MAIEKPAPWTGASGREYVFYVFGLEPGVPHRLGSYIYAKRNAEGAWVPVYMGHGELSDCCTDPDLRRCIASKAATHLHLRLNSLEADREAELRDLLAHYANAFAPEGCHTEAKGAASARPKAAASSESTTPKTAAAKRAPAKTTAKKTTAETTTAKKAATKRAATKKAATRKAPTKKATRKTPVKAKPKSRRPPSK